MGSVTDTISYWSRVEGFSCASFDEKEMQSLHFSRQWGRDFPYSKSTEGFGEVSETNKQQIQNDGRRENKALF